MLFTRTNTLRLVSSIKKNISLFKSSKFNFSNSSKNKEAHATQEESNKTDFQEINTKNLVDLIESEIKSEETSYESIDAEKNEFLSKNRWVLFEKTKPSEKNLFLELKKSTSEYDISVKFASKPPEVVDSTKDDSGKK
jgi:hypothetical protein